MAMTIRIHYTASCVVLGLIWLLGGGCVADGVMDLRQGSPAILRHTVKELREQHVIKQQEDYSCGAAALATLLVYYFGDATTEREILTSLESHLSQEERKQKVLRGFSLLDLKRVSEERGYKAAGFRLPISQLAQVTAPVILFLEPMGYKHFAVFRGLYQGRVYLADPARGNVRLTLGRFLDEWTGIVFVLGKPGEEQITDYPLKVPHPSYVQPELAHFTAQVDWATWVPTLSQR
jgi:predicted double-glycine peptidase